MTKRFQSGTQLHESFLVYARYRWLKLALLLVVLVIMGYALIDQKPRPNGGSAYGYALGTMGVGLIIWLALLGVRKRWITRGRWSLMAWTSAHVYLGIALVVVATLHSGFQLGWNVHSLAYGLLLTVVASGLFGIYVYARVPRALSLNRGEVTQPQMLEGLRSLDRQLYDAGLGLDGAHARILADAIQNGDIGGSLWSRLSGRYPGCSNTRALRILQSQPVTPGLVPIIALLERKAVALALTRRQVVFKTRLEIWLYLHVPMTVALLAALTAHIVSVFFYW
jgi:hypothetical protein